MRELKAYYEPDALAAVYQDVIPLRNSSDWQFDRLRNSLVILLVILRRNLIYCGEWLGIR